MRFLAAVLRAGLRVVRGLALVALVAAMLGVVALIRAGLSADSPANGGALFQAPRTYELPSPSYWPLSPYPIGSINPEPTAQASVAPCPSWAPTLVKHPDGTYECKAYIPPDPGGPYIAPPVSPSP